MEVFRSIRYARAGRFCHPVMEKGAEQAPQAVCPQRESRLGGIMGPMMTGNPLSEDCLRLSIFTPDVKGSRPVMVWICGGAFITGSGEFARYDASRLCKEGGIVVVNISYRVGALGFLYMPEKGCINLGIEDQICALHWIHEHIADFGGDPDRITLCGQSAGAYSITNIISRGHTDLFCSAILFSAPYVLSGTPSSGNRIRRIFTKELSKAASDPSRDLYDASIDEILVAQAATLRAVGSALPFCPVGEQVFPKGGIRAGNLRRVMLTCLKDDAQPFVPFKWLTRPATAFIFRRPMFRYAAMLQEAGISTVTKVFTWHPRNNGIGACHTLELPFIFGTWESWNQANMLAGCTREEYEERGLRLRKTIADFVKGE